MKCTPCVPLSLRSADDDVVCLLLIATLIIDVALQVCCGWRCDMFEELQGLRTLRPCNGGCGFDESVVQHLRSLNFDVPAPTILEQSSQHSKL